MRDLWRCLKSRDKKAPIAQYEQNTHSPIKRLIASDRRFWQQYDQPCRGSPLSSSLPHHQSGGSSANIQIQITFMLDQAPQVTLFRSPLQCPSNQQKFGIQCFPPKLTSTANTPCPSNSQVSKLQQSQVDGFNVQNDPSAEADTSPNSCNTNLACVTRPFLHAKTLLFGDHDTKMSQCSFIATRKLRLVPKVRQGLPAGTQEGVSRVAAVRVMRTCGSQSLHHYTGD